jgi:hypothetical protein
MSAVDWSLQRAGAGLLQSFTDWGICSGLRKSINGATGTLELGFGATDLLIASPFDPDEELLVLRDGVPWFRGRLTAEKRGAYGSTEGLVLTLSDPWWYLEKIIYEQQAQFVNSPTANPTPAKPTGLQLSDFTLVTKATSDIIVSQDETGSLVDSKAQIIDALNYAIAKGAPLAIGTIDAGIAIPRTELRDVTCAQIILASIRWTPDQTTWWDFSVDPPALNIRDRANRPLYNIDIADQAVAQVELNERRDLTLSGVTLNYLRTNQRSNFEFVTLDKDQAGPDPEGIGALIFTQELYGTSFIETTSSTGEVVGTTITPAEDIPVGLAARLYAVWGVAPWEGRISLVADDLAAMLWLSQTARVLSGNPAWAAATMDIQQASEDIFTGRTELTIGPPTQLGPSDLIGLVRKVRTVLPTPSSGGTPTSNPFPPTNPPPTLQFGPPTKPNTLDVTLNFPHLPSTNIFAPGWNPAPSVQCDQVIIVDSSGGTLAGPYDPGACNTIAEFDGVMAPYPFTVRILTGCSYLGSVGPPVVSPPTPPNGNVITITVDADGKMTQSSTPKT